MGTVKFELIAFDFELIAIPIDYCNINEIDFEYLAEGGLWIN